MATYLIGYDLNRPRGEDDYQDLISDIKKTFPTYWHNLDSTWLVKSDWTAAQIRDHFLPFLDSGDELLIVKLTRESAWFGFSDRAASWLRDNL